MCATSPLITNCPGGFHLLGRKYLKSEINFSLIWTTIPSLPIWVKAAHEKTQPSGLALDWVSNRDSPNLRSADRPLLDGRAMVHPIIKIVCRSCEGGGHAGKCGAGTGHLGASINGIGELGVHAIQHLANGISSGNPICCSAFHRGRIISARLLRSPVSSDCAFILEGCSVSSRYTFPIWGLARRFLLLSSL